MKRNTFTLFLALLFVLSFAVISSAQDLNLEEMVLPPNYGSKPANEAQMETQSNLDEVIQPLLDLFGFYSGGGLYHTADIHGTGGFDVGLRVITMMVKNDQKPPLPFPNDENLNGGVFRDMTLMPLPVLQASLGLPGNIEATGRFFTYPMGDGDKKGNITLIGIGVKYGLLQNMLLPRVAIVGAYHYLTVPADFDFGNVSSISGAVVASKSFLGILEAYGSVGIDYNKFEVDMNLPDPIGKVTKNYTNQNVRYIVGLKISPFPLLYIHADYDFGKVQGFNVGAGVSFR
ncbi:MAG: hypothetical protein GXO74_02965 [Calditrichaeota bacterium]|nr:hypothetical protein [Calditrichota bacterium]